MVYLSSMKKILNNPIFNAIIILLITYFVYSKMITSNLEEVLSSLKQVNIGYLILSVLSQVLMVFLASLALFKIGQLFTSKMKLSFSITTTMIGFLAANILPLGSGMQVFQYMVLKENDIDNNDIVATLWIEFISYQMALVILAWGIVLSNFSVVLNDSFNIGIMIGVVVSSFVLLSLTLLSFSTNFYRFVNWVVIKGVKVLRLKVDINHFNEQLDTHINKFKDTLNLFRNNKKLMMTLLFLNLFRLLALVSCGYLVARAFGLDEFNYYSIISRHVFILMLISFIPVPGASGTTEFFFTHFFSSIYLGLTTSILLLWRFVSYYLIIIVGTCFFLVFKLRKRRKTI